MRRLYLIWWRGGWTSPDRDTACAEWKEACTLEEPKKTIMPRIRKRSELSEAGEGSVEATSGKVQRSC